MFCCALMVTSVCVAWFFYRSYGTFYILSTFYLGLFHFCAFLLLFHKFLHKRLYIRLISLSSFSGSSCFLTTSIICFAYSFDFSLYLIHPSLFAKFIIAVFSFFLLI